MTVPILGQDPLLRGYLRAMTDLLARLGARLLKHHAQPVMTFVCVLAGEPPEAGEATTRTGAWMILDLRPAGVSGAAERAAWARDLTAELLVWAHARDPEVAQ
jgi:hypothetical protein